MKNPSISIIGLGVAVAIVSGCAAGNNASGDSRPGYERVFAPGAMTHQRVACSSLDPRQSNQVPGCIGSDRITVQDFNPGKGELAQIAYSDAGVPCGALRPEFAAVALFPECFVWRKLPTVEAGGGPRPPAPAPAPPPSPVKTSAEGPDTKTSVSITHDEDTKTVKSEATAGNVHVSTQRETDTTTENQTVTFNAGTDNEWTAQFDAETETWSRVADDS